MLTPHDITFIFAPGVQPSQMSDYSHGVIAEACATTNNPVVQVDSLQRTPAQQAHAMWGNLEQHGVANQRALYTTHDGHPLPGCKVIDVYELAKVAHATPGDTIMDMTDTILAIGPETVSAHCRDPKKTQVVDLLRSKFRNPLDLIARLKTDPRVSKVLDEAFNHCVHLEVPTPS